MKDILIIITVLTILLATGCAKVEKTEQEPVDVSRFECVEETSVWVIVADRETGVMYAVSRGIYNQGSFALLVDAEGKPLIWDEGEQE